MAASWSSPGRRKWRGCRWGSPPHASYLGDLSWFAGASIADLLLGTGIFPFHYQDLAAAKCWLETPGNTVEFTLAAYLMRRLLGRGSRLDRPFDVAAMVGSLIAGVTIAAVSGAVSVWLDAGLPTSGLWSLACTWWLGNMSGGLLVAPLMLVWAQRSAPVYELLLDWRAAGQSAAILALVVVLSIAAFSQPYPLALYRHSPR